MTALDLSGFRLTAKAESDLEDIWRYTAETWSPAQAERYVGDLLGTLETLVAMPTLARERTEFTPAVRIHPTAQHLIVYRINAPWLDVIRVLGGRQNWRAVLDRVDA